MEAWAKPIDFKLVEPEEAGCFINLFDDTYHEPFHYIYACIAMAANIKLFGFTSLAIEGRRITPHKKCCDIDDDPCGVFADMPFPVDLFLPKQEK